jgi:hypothetical protein
MHTATSLCECVDVGRSCNVGKSLVQPWRSCRADGSWASPSARARWALTSVATRTPTTTTRLRTATAADHAPGP